MRVLMSYLWASLILKLQFLHIDLKMAASLNFSCSSNASFFYIIIYSEKLPAGPRVCSFSCLETNESLFPCHVLGHYYLITEMSNFLSLRPNCFASTYTSHSSGDMKSLVSARGDLFCMTLVHKKMAEGCEQSLDTHSSTWRLSLCGSPSPCLSVTHTRSFRKLWRPRIGHISNAAMF